MRRLRLTSDTVERLGGIKAIAEMTGMALRSVYDWQATGIPKSRLMQLQLATQFARIKIDWTTAVEEIPPAETQAA